MIIYRKNIPVHLQKLGWFAGEQVEVYKLSETEVDVNTIKSTRNEIRFGGTSNTEVYFWNGDVFHKVVEHALNMNWDLALVYPKNSIKLVLSDRYRISADEFRNYLKVDELYRSIIKRITNKIPIIKYIEVAKEKIKI